MPPFKVKQWKLKFIAEKLTEYKGLYKKMPLIRPYFPSEENSKDYRKTCDTAHSFRELLWDGAGYAPVVKETRLHL